MKGKNISQFPSQGVKNTHISLVCLAHITVDEH